MLHGSLLTAFTGDAQTRLREICPIDIYTSLDSLSWLIYTFLRVYYSSSSAAGTLRHPAVLLTLLSAQLYTRH